MAITQVKATTSSIQSWQGDALITTVPVAADGSFRLEIPPMTGVRFNLLAANGRSTVVFPRQTGKIPAALAIRPNGGAFDFGLIRFVGDASTASWAFMTTTGPMMGCDDEGRDAAGAMCVDDSDAGQTNCGQDEGDHQDGDHQDGDHQGGDQQMGDNQSGDNHDDQAGENDTSNDGPEMGQAVAEHNFPSNGCAGGHDDHGDGASDGASND